ncbi:hypothetical protein JAAARDRAFT_33256 [Jaapia argillacea MUCL 33604]|uniref:T-cell immunomodulatory protein TIP C2 domain-containing protein n=1 Tax=Jaapia argillacea MUCL 33604 TaxID=933084 RepID=A0A067Q859_9AGAM|nr:hypothetical protein JAAARDRAFT_33256 [Jaapia argillacea MUCL 33604]
MCSWLALFSIALVQVSPVASIWPFPPKRFKGNALIGAGSMGVDVEGRVIAFGDFNGDQFLDLLSLGSDEQTLSVYLWNHDDFIFKQSASFRHPGHVYNVVPGDFTQDGKLDLLVMSQGQASRQLAMYMYLASPEGGFDFNPISLPTSSLSQPIPFDSNGDMKIDLIGMTPSSSSSRTDPFQVWQNVWNASRSNSPIFDIVDAPFTGAQCTISNPHSNAMVDLNGDCLSDIFLLCDETTTDKYFQIWVNQKDSGFALAQQTHLPRGVQSISFADIDRDGTIDMIFSTCSSVSASTGVGQNCYINIAYNQQLPLCTSATAPSVGKNGKRICRPPEQLCTVDPDFKFDLTASSDNDAFVRFPITDLFPSSSLLVRDTTHNPPLPLPLKFGDVDLDGFPDLVPIISSGQDFTPKLVSSVPCAVGVVGCGKDGKGKRGWKVVRKGVDTLNNIRDARGVTFLDMDEDGTLDIMVQRSGKQGEGTILFVQNNFYYDAFFLKAIVLNSACAGGWCTTPNGSERYHPYGVSYSGATYKYTVLDTSGRRSAAQVPQLPQTAYQSLLTPYSYFGLGRTNNYIENLFVGSTLKHPSQTSPTSSSDEDQHFINMEGVIPNSKVVIMPPGGGEKGGVWRRELYLRPGEWIPWVTVTVVVATIVLGVIVIVLHLNEKREDELERRRASHHINFDAL